MMGVSDPAANELVSRLEDVGLLRETTGYVRSRPFRFEPYLRLFEDPEVSS